VDIPSVGECPALAFASQVYALTGFLRENGAEAVAAADLGYVFSRDNPLYAKLEAGL
jgi:ATP phosphoribosyltransferase